MRVQTSIALIGEVDAGKSTTLGQILLKTGSVLQSRVEEASKASKRQNKDFEPAFLLDAFEYERENEMTVDITTISCRWGDFDIRFLDTPGHKELSNKFIGGAIRADLALLILDSEVPLKKEHFRHAEMLRALGLTDFGLVINKWDNKTESEYQKFKQDLQPWVEKLDVKLHFTVPVAARAGLGFDQKSAYQWCAEPLLPSLEKVSEKIGNRNSAYAISKISSDGNFYWLSFEDGSPDKITSLYSHQSTFDIKSLDWVGGRIAQLKDVRDLPSLLTCSPNSILYTSDFKISIVPLEDDWQNFENLRTRWASQKAIFLNNSTIKTEKPFPFIKNNSRANLFILERDEKILAVGVPVL